MILCESEDSMDSYKGIELIELITLVKEHDDNAFSELVTRYTPMMNKVIGGFTGSHLRYDEAFSEACVALHRAAMSYDNSRSGDITFGLYSRICVYRRICDIIEKSSKQAPIVDMDVELISSESNIEQRLVGRERMAEYVRKACSVLSDYEYSVFLLYIEGYTTAEISKQLEKDAKSVENAKSRMLKRLREVGAAFHDN